LQGGPKISFFRHSNKISLVWKADHLGEFQSPLWTAGNGELEMEYEDFIYQIEDFGNRFFDAVESQLALGIARDWGHTVIDKVRVIEEQKERKMNINKQVALLKGNPGLKTNWRQIETLLEEMQ
jgi:hypothetical protein